MEVIRGTDRLVVPVGEYVLKFPRASVSLAITDILDGYEQAKFPGVRMKWEIAADAQLSPKWFLLHGLIANNREARLAKAFPKIVLQTRSLLGGLLNIQPQVEPVSLSGDDIADVFVERVGVLTTITLGHMVKHPENFGVCDDGNVRFVDGGSSGLEKSLLQRGKHDQITAALQEITKLSS